jgi:hypothetical protein
MQRYAINTGNNASCSDFHLLRHLTELTGMLVVQTQLVWVVFAYGTFSQPQIGLASDIFTSQIQPATP